MQIYDSGSSSVIPNNNNFIGNVFSAVRSTNILAPSQLGGRFERNIVNLQDRGSIGISVGSNSLMNHNTVLWGTAGARQLRVGDGPSLSGVSITNNLLQSPEARGVYIEEGSSAAVDTNLIASGQGTTLGTNAIVGVDPLLVDAGSSTSPVFPNARLQPGSPAIGAATDGGSLGALEYPNVFYVDQSHPAATDQLYGYQAVPFMTLGQAVSAANSGETIIVRAGTYRESVVLSQPIVTIQAYAGDQVYLSGADKITGWTRLGIDQWFATLASQPTAILRDGASWTGFTYDAVQLKITISGGGDPRLHSFETVVRQSVLDTGGLTGIVVQGISTVNLLP